MCELPESRGLSPAPPRNHLHGEEQKGLAQQIPIMPGIVRNGSTNLRMIYVLITVYSGALAHVPRAVATLTLHNAFQPNAICKGSVLLGPAKLLPRYYRRWPRIASAFLFHRSAPAAAFEPFLLVFFVPVSSPPTRPFLPAALPAI